MPGSILVEVDSSQLELYSLELSRLQSKLQSDLEELKRAYQAAEWNDIISEKARTQLNEYIDAYHRATEQLSFAASTVSRLCCELEDYADSIH